MQIYFFGALIATSLRHSNKHFTDMKTIHYLALAATATVLLSYGCTKDHNRGRFPSDNRTDVKPTEVEAVLTNDWTIRYVGRQDETLDDGTSGQYELFSVTPSASAAAAAYYFDILKTDKTMSDDNGNMYDELTWWYDGKVLDFFEDDVNIANKQGNAPVSGSQQFTWDRLYEGNYRVYVFGVDSKGNPTGRYSVMDLSLKQEVPTEAYSKWLGKWEVTGKKKNDINSTATYMLEIVQAESNYSYYIDGWEWENGSKLNTDLNGTWFTAWFNKNAGTIVISPFVNRSMTFENGSGLLKQIPDGTYDLTLVGNYYFNGLSSTMSEGEYHYIGQGIMAEAFMDSEETATIKPWKITLDESGYTTDYTSMQFMLIDADADGDGFYHDVELNQDVPVFPLSMTRSHASSTSSRATVAHAPKVISENPMGRPSYSRRRTSATKSAANGTTFASRSEIRR